MAAKRKEDLTSIKDWCLNWPALDSLIFESEQKAAGYTQDIVTMLRGEGDPKLRCCWIWSVEFLRPLGWSPDTFLQHPSPSMISPSLSSLAWCLAIPTLPLHSAWSNTDTAGPLMCDVPTNSPNWLISAAEALPCQSLHLANFYFTLTRTVITFFNALTPASNKLPGT